MEVCRILKAKLKATEAVVEDLRIAYYWMDLPKMDGWDDRKKQQTRQKYRLAKNRICDRIATLSNHDEHKDEPEEKHYLEEGA